MFKKISFLLALTLFFPLVTHATTTTESVRESSLKKNIQPYQADLVATSNDKIIANIGGEIIPFMVRYHNSGSNDWQQYNWQELGSRSEKTISNDPVNLADTSWLNSRLVLIGSAPVLVNENINIVFNLRAPKTEGKYIARFRLIADEHSVVGSVLEIPIEVLANAPDGYIEPILPPSEAVVRTPITEPVIRVGLYKTKEVVEWRSDYEYTIFSGDEEKGNVEPGQKVSLSYKKGEYKFNSPNLKFVSTNSIRLVPTDQEAVFSLSNYKRLVSWKGKSNFNVYRGVMEYKYSPRSQMPFVINELPLDQYIAGIGETSNGAALEYIKAILVAARSYAYYHLNDQVRDAKYMFDVYATTVDQLYLGYNSELLMPKVVQAAEATYGEMVTYDKNPVIVPYFANSDGMTKLWSTVWGGQDKPWIQPVECVYDIGKKKYGHGVGMSASDAAQRADKDGWTYDQLLQYYYTGVEIEKIY